MTINSFIKEIQENIPYWRADEIIVIVSFLLKNDQYIKELDLAFILNELNRYTNSFLSVKQKNEIEIKDAINLISKKVTQLDGHNRKLILKTFACIKKLIGISDEYLDFNDSSSKEFLEGDKKVAFHFYRERNSKLIKAKKHSFIREYGKLFCEVCEFNFQDNYGDRGKDFAEIHHNVPISSSDFMRSTQLDDLSVLCSNCHRMIHRKEPWLNISELKKIIKNGKAA